MKRVIFLLDGQRVDKPDANALHMLTEGEFRRLGEQFLAGPALVAVAGFSVDLVGAEQPKQIRVLRGIAFSGETLPDGTVAAGHILGEGPDSMLWNFAGRDPGTWHVWARFVSREGDEQNRAYLADVNGVGIEQVALTATRIVPEWEVVATRDGADPDPGAPWFRVAEVAYSGADLEAGDIADARDLYFEGAAAGGQWTIPEFNRSTARGVNGIADLRAWVLAVARRLEEIGGRRWYTAPTFGESVRSASAAVTVVADAAQASSAHKVLTTAADFIAAFVEPGTTDDRRQELHFLPAANGSRPLYSIDVTEAPILALAVTRRYVRGAATLARTAGANPLVQIIGAAVHATFEGIHFRADAGADPLWRFAAANYDFTFLDCVFEAAGGAPTSLVRLTHAGRLRFVRTRFILGDLAASDALLIEAAADIVCEACTWTGGRYGIHITTAPKSLVVNGGEFVAQDVGIRGTTGAAQTCLTGPVFSQQGTAAVDVAGADGAPGIYYSGAGGAGAVTPNNPSGALVTGAALEASTLRAARGRVYLDAGTEFPSRYIAAPGGVFTGRARNLARLDAEFRSVHAQRIAYQSAGDGATAGLGASHEYLTPGGALPERVCLQNVVSDGNGGEVRSVDLPYQVDRILYGALDSDAAWLHRNLTPKAWVQITRGTQGIFTVRQSCAWRPSAAEDKLTVTSHKDAARDDRHYFKIAKPANRDWDGFLLPGRWTAHVSIRSTNLLARHGVAGGGEGAAGTVLAVEQRFLGNGRDGLFLLPYAWAENGDRLYFEDEEWATLVDGVSTLPNTYEIEVLLFGAADNAFADGGGDA